MWTTSGRRAEPGAGPGPAPPPGRTSNASRHRWRAGGPGGPHGAPGDIRAATTGRRARPAGRGVDPVDQVGAGGGDGLVVDLRRRRRGRRGPRPAGRGRGRRGSPRTRSGNRWTTRATLSGRRHPVEQLGEGGAPGPGGRGPPRPGPVRRRPWPAAPAGSARTASVASARASGSRDGHDPALDAVGHGLGHAAAVGDHDRPGAGHGLERGVGDALAEAGQQRGRRPPGRRPATASRPGGGVRVTTSVELEVVDGVAGGRRRRPPRPRSRR